MPAAILWALQIALEKNWDQIIVEGDAKSCIDSLVPEFKGKASALVHFHLKQKYFRN